MSLVGCLAALLWLARAGSAGGAATLFLCTVSHPMLDVLFHDAYFSFGNRAVSRLAYFGGLWQSASLAALGFALELALCVFPYLWWRAARMPADASESTLASIRRNERLFWLLALGYNMPSLYLISPAWQHVAWPAGFRMGVLGWPDAAVLWTWCLALAHARACRSATRRRVG